ncbi:MAG: TatD family hydrolase [Planctomycetota bacterium]
MLVDTHCHLTSDRFIDDREAVLERMQAAGVVHAICIGTGCADGEAVRSLCQEQPSLLSGTAGLDPFSCHQAGAAFADELARLEALLGLGGWVGLGEIGLDYHYDLDPAPVQRERFALQLDLAARLDLPVVIHVRDAVEDCLAVLREHPTNRGVIHSFTGHPAAAEGFLGLGWHLSFNGIATFKNAPEVAAAAAACPADRLLVETDSPYLAPVPRRGKRCEPAFVAHTLDFIAQLRGERAEDCAAWTTRNATRLFRLPLPEWG